MSLHWKPFDYAALADLRRQFQDLTNLGRASDWPWVARHPWRAHRLLGHLVKAFPCDLDRAEAPRHPESGDELIEHVGGILVRMAHRGRYQSLALAVYCLVPAHHR